VDEDAAAFLAYQSDPRAQESCALAIAARARPGGLVGSVGLRGAGVPAGAAEFGLEVAPSVRRLGVRPVEERAGPAWLAARGWHEVEWELRREAWDAGGG
jgi:hypothetical protein